MQLIGNSRIVCCWFCMVLILCCCSTIINWFRGFLWWRRWWFIWWIAIPAIVWASWARIASGARRSPVAVATTVVIPIVVAIVVVPTISIVAEIPVLKSAIESIAWKETLDVIVVCNWFTRYVYKLFFNFRNPLHTHIENCGYFQNIQNQNS